MLETKISCIFLSSIKIDIFTNIGNSYEMNKHTIASEKLLQFKCIVLDDNCRTFFDFDSLASIAKELRTVVLQEDAIFNDENFVVIDEVFEFFKFVRIFIKNVRSCTSDSEHDSTDSVPLHEASIRKSCYIFCQVRVFKYQ